MDFGTGWPSLRQTDRYGAEYRSLVTKEFKDGGAALGLPVTTPMLRWIILYDGLYDSEAYMIDSHYLSANGMYDGFTFRHPRTGVLYSDVHYEKFTVDHRKTWIQRREVTLLKRPPA